MRWLMIVAVAALASLCASAGRAAEEGEKGVEIPLEHIWGTDLQWPRPLRDLEPEYLPKKRATEFTRAELKEIRKRAEQSWTLPLERLRSLNLGDGRMRAGFAVAGTGREALKQVHGVLIDEQKPNTDFVAESEICVAFFSDPERPSVVLDRVDHFGNEIRISFRMIPSGIPSGGEFQLWLIPLGKLPTGQYQVRTLRSAKDDQPSEWRFPRIDDTFAMQVVSQPFSFVVEKEK